MIALLFVACSHGGCPADPGGPCTPGQSDCRGDFYCSVGGVCTKECQSDSDCNPACETAEDCGSSDGAPDWTCESSVCLCKTSTTTCPEAVSCIDGHCQRSCALAGGCTFDPYAPRS